MAKCTKKGVFLRILKNGSSVLRYPSEKSEYTTRRWAVLANHRNGDAITV